MSSALGYPPATQTGRIPFTPPGTQLRCETAYWLWGDLKAQIPPLVILHGGPGAPGRDWQPISALNGRHGIPVLLYDQIGCGESTHLRETIGDTTLWTNELFVTELENLLRALEIQTFDILGHSDGGITAILFALTQPRGLRKLILASVPASEALRIQAQGAQRALLPPKVRDYVLKCEEEGKVDSPEYGEAMLALAKMNVCRLGPWPKEVMETISLMMDDNTVAATLYGPVPLHTTGPRKDYNVVSRLANITETTAPGGVLLTNGHYDMNQDFTMMPFLTNIRAKVRWVRFGESAHMPHIEESEAYLDVLGRFLTTE